MAQVKALTGQVTTLNLAFNSLDAAAQKTKVAMANAFAANVGSMGAFTTKMVQMKTSADQFGESIQKNRLTMTQYFKEAAVGLVRQDSLLKQYARQQVRYQQSVVTGMGAGPSGKPMAMIMTPKDVDIRNAATRMKVLNQEFNIFRTLVGQGATEMINFGKNTQWTGRQLTVGLTMPVVLFGATFAKVFMSIDKELTRFAKVYGEDLVNSNGKATEQMKQQVMDLAKTISSTLGVAASETAGLAADVAATGKTGQELLDTVAQTTRLAVLGEVDRQEAMKATLAIQSAFKQNTEELAESINFLNAIENQTSTTLNDLVEAIPKAGPVIKGLGGDIKDLSVLMVAMKEGGIPAAEAANAIKSGMASLINPTKKAADTAKEFGVNIEGIVKSNKGQLMPTIFALQSALNGLDDFSKSRVIEELFGKYQFARLSALFNNLGKAGSQTQQAMELAGASTVSLAAIANKELRAYTESTTVRFKRMVESIKNQLLPIGEALLEGLMPILKAASGIIETVGGLFEKIPDSGKGFLKFVGAITLLAGPALMLIGLFKQLVGNGIKAAMSIATLGARLAGIKVGPLQHLDSETAAANAQVEILSNSFVSQSTALNILNKELANYRAGLQKLAYTNPQMFTPPIGGRPTTRPPIRRAGGGDVPGGYGGGDSVPALLESGEFVVRKEAASKYRPILDAMNSGTIKGLVLGTKKQSALHAAHTQTAFDPRTNQYVYGMELIAEKFGLTTKQLENFNNKFPEAIKILGKSVATLPDNINYALKGTGALSEDFRAGFDKTKGMAYLPTALQGGFNIQEEGATEAVKQFTNRVKERAIAIADATNKGLVTDGILDKAQREVIKEIHQTADSQDPVQKSSKKLALIIDQQAGRLGEARIAVNQKQIRDNPKDFVVKGNTTYYIDRSSGQMIPVSEVGPTGRRRPITVKYSAADSAGGTAADGGPRIPLYTPALRRVVTEGTGSGYLNAPQGLKLVEKEVEKTTNSTVKAVLNAFVLAFRKAQRSGSPAEEYADRMKVEGRNASDGSIKGFRIGLSGVDEGMGQAAQQAGRSSLDKIRRRMQDLGPTPAAGDSSPYTPAPQGPGVMGASIMMSEARKQGIAGATGRFYGLLPEERKRMAAEARVKTGYGRETDYALLGRSRDGLEQTGPRRSLSEGLMNKSSGLMNIGFMGSMVAGMMSMNGEVNAATTALMAFTTATMAAGSVMQMMSMFSGGGGKGFMGLKGLGNAMESRGAAMSAAGGARGAIGGGLTRLAPMVIGAGGPIGIGVAAAITAAVGGFVLYKKAAGEARERAEAAFKDPAKSAEYFGKTLKDVNSALKDIAASGASEEIGAIDQGLRTAVAEDYATLIEKIKTTVTTTGASDLAAAYNKMLASGLSADEAIESIKAIAVEAGTAGGLAYSKAFAGGMLSAKTPEEAYKQMIDMINPNSQFNVSRVASLEADRQNIQANPEGLSKYGRGYSQEQIDQLGGITEALNISGEAFASTLQTAIELSQTSPEIVKAQAGALKDAFTALNSSDFSFGFGKSEQEVAFDSFKNLMGELKDPATNKVMDSLQNATTEAQGLAMELVSLGIPLTAAADASGRFSDALANAAIESKSKIIDLNEAIKDLNSTFNSTTGRGMRSLMNAAQAEYDKLLNRREGFDKTTNFNIGRMNKSLNDSKVASDAAVKGMESEIKSMEEKIKLREEENDEIVKGLEKEKERIQETTDKYLQSIQKRQQADNFYANQRKSNIGALGKLASGDVFGFLQDRQAMANEAKSFSYDNEIKAIEERRDAEVDSIDKTIEKKNKQTEEFVKAQQKQIDKIQEQIDLEKEAMDRAEKDTQERIKQYERIRKAQSDKLDDQITKQNSSINTMKTVNEGMKAEQILSFQDVTKAYGEEIAKQYVIFAKNLIKMNFEKMKEEGKSATALTNYLTTRYAELFPQQDIEGMNPLYTQKTKLSATEIAGAIGVTIPTAATGGYISGPGGPTEDKIPAMLSNGEYVIKASSVNKYGANMMNSINMGQFAGGGYVKDVRASMFGMGGMAKSMPRYAVGGQVSDPSGLGNMPSAVYNININANGIQDPEYFANKVVNIINRKQSRTDHSRSVLS